jgi:hypothetical protein
MAGFELIIADEILRARFRNSFERPEPVPANSVLKYAIDLHTNAHAFLKGHRIMVQVQSTWFPVYDRNPQKYLPNIFEAHDTDYIKATQRIYRAPRAPSAVVCRWSGKQPYLFGYSAAVASISMSSSGNANRLTPKRVEDGWQPAAARRDLITS